MNCYYWFGVIFRKCKKVFDLNVARLHTNGFYLISVFIKVAFLPLHMDSTGALLYLLLAVCGVAGFCRESLLQLH